LDKLTDANNNYKLPSNVNGMFPLRISKKEGNNSDKNNVLSFVGVSIVVRREDQVMNSSLGGGNDPGLSPVKDIEHKNADRVSSSLKRWFF